MNCFGRLDLPKALDMIQKRLRKKEEVRVHSLCSLTDGGSGYASAGGSASVRMSSMKLVEHELPFGAIALML